MTLSLEINTFFGALAFKIAGAALKRRKGLAWKSRRGLRPWQMYVWVSWKPGRSEISFLQRTGKEYRYNNILVLQGNGSLPAVSRKEDTKKGNQGRYRPPTERGGEKDYRKS